MSGITEENVENFKTEHESDEHWELRRKFLLAHKDKFKQEELICLAQVFTNVEFLGCRYPQETMRTVAELSKDVVQDYREKQKTRLQRTFVGASDAASSKAKGRFKQESQSTVIAGSSTENNGPKSVYTDFKRKSNTDIEAISSESQIKKRYTFKPLTADDIVLYQYENEKAPTMIARLAQTNNVVMEWKYDNIEDKCRCTLLFNKGKVAEGVGLTQKDAKVEACNAALKEMQKRYYTIKVTKNLTPTINLEEKSEPASDYINSDNIGSKMMKMMGWSGGGLGKKSQGMVEPVSSTLQQQVTREGLGLKVGTYNIGAFRKKCSEVLRNYVKNQITTDMVFSPCFTNEERHVIHLVAKQMGLKSQSYGPKTSRILTISRKILPHELVNQLLESGGSTEKYELIKPTELQSL
ncbi:hypothetical protein TKK_0001746 [Trichogramma kaykai]|uniref:NF-kappa-B-repressing factor n=1 Tax=Trichogramma kaykai TaxID=54128 RepID=A0ABD2XFE5_9HYME